MRSQLPWANLLTGLRLLLTPLVAWAILQEHWLLAAPTFFIAVITDVLDGRIARRLNQASASGGLFDHATDALFVTTSAASVAAHGTAPWLLVVLIPAAFVQYMLDSKALSGHNLRTSLIGRWNGVAYFFVPGTFIVVQGAGFNWFDLDLLYLAAWGLVVSTLISMSDRAIAWLRLRSQ
jgi:phosphatidylglycerophosphate synthase